MLTALEIKNYQGHRSSVIEFHKGVNIICGTSDSGKTAVLRAMLWALRNRPMGDGFKNWDATEKDIVSVAMEFDNDWLVKKRENGKNRYETEDGTYEALRADVPEEVQEIHDLKECNIQTQFQPYFMLQNSPGERGKQLNELVGLDIIDRVFKKINAKITGTKRDIGSANTKVESLKAEIAKLPNLLPLESILNRLTDDINNAEKTREKLTSLSADIDKLYVIEEEIEKQKQFLEIEALYLSLNKKMMAAESLHKSIMSINYDLSAVHKLSIEIKEDKDWLAVAPYHRTIMLKIAGVSTLETYIKELDKLIESEYAVAGAIEIEKAGLRAKKDQYVKLLEEAGKCPTCHNVMGHSERMVCRGEL